MKLENKVSNGIATLATFTVGPLITGIRGIVYSGLLKMMEILNLITQRRFLIQRRLEEEGKRNVSLTLVAEYK